MTAGSDTLYAMALTRISHFNYAAALALYRELGNARAIYDHRADIGDIVDGCSPRLSAALACWDEPLRRAEAEMEFMQKHGIRPLTLADDGVRQTSTPSAS